MPPVALPPGRLKPWTRPSSTGSSPIKKIIGMLCGPLLGRKRRGLAAGRNNRGNSTTDQVSRERRQSIESSLGPSVFDDDVSALDEPGFHQSFAERLREVGKSIGRSAVKKADYRLHGLLRASG